MTTLLIVGGGTGGHIIPGLAVARCASDRGASIVWLGTGRGLEQDLVCRAGYPMRAVPMSTLRSNGGLVGRIVGV